MLEATEIPVDTILAGLSGLIAALILIAVTVGATVDFLRSRPAWLVTSVHGSLESLRAIRDLSVCKVLAKEIVTTVDHSWGEFGRKYLEWADSSRKMAIIFEFAIDFRYDLKRSDFQIIGAGSGRFILKMLPWLYDANVKSIQVYDEQRSKLLPFLLPDLLNGSLGAGFTEDHKNRLFSAARSVGNYGVRSGT